MEDLIRLIDRAMKLDIDAIKELERRTEEVGNSPTKLQPNRNTRMSEFDLSEKRKELPIIDKLSLDIPLDSEGYVYYREEDVKEFIKRLKETIEEGVNRNDVLPLDWCFDRIDKLAGNKLTGEEK